MKSVCCWLLLLLGLVAATQAIKCLCDKPFCLDDAAQQEEECPGSFDKDFLETHREALDKLEIDMEYQIPYVRLFSDKIRRRVIDLPQLTEAQLIEHKVQWKKEAIELKRNLSIEEKARLIWSFGEIASILEANEKAGMKPDAAILEMMDQAFNGTYKLKHIDYNFCIKKIDGKGTVSRSCGIKGVETFRTEMKVGCHTNPVYEATLNDYPKYCRCDADLCNSGDVGMTEEENASSSPDFSSMLIAGCLVRVCYFVVM